MSEESWKKHTKLFIPGPVEVYPDTLQELAIPTIGHRSPEFKDLYADTVPKLKEVLYTNQEVFISTSSATGVWEGSLRNLVNKKVLSCMNGAFSDKWYDVALLNGKAADKLQVEWGKAIKPEMIDEKLATGEYDAITFVHNETSTGVANPLYEVAEVIKKYPDVMFIVDAVSSMTAMKIEIDKLGIDCCLASVQKAFAIPPGLAVFTVSNKAMEKMETVENRGYYFDFKTFKKYADKDNTPSTPPIPQIFALNHQVKKFLAEGMENRFARHIKMKDMVHNWVSEKGFELFAETGYESDSLTTITNNKDIDVGGLNKKLREKGMIISNGYGNLKDKTFRIAHMGDTKPEEIQELLGNIDEIIG
jgi:predicted phosphoserine aminotransferase